MIVSIADKVYWTLVPCSMTEAETGFLLPAGPDSIRGYHFEDEIETEECILMRRESL
jgi:hypothetical protein